MPTMQRSILLLGIALVIMLSVLPAQAQQPEQTTNKLYLPFVATPSTPGVFGFETTRLSEVRGIDLSLAIGSGISWMRRNGLRWRDVQPERGAPLRWDNTAVRHIEDDLRNAAQHQINVILVIRGSPQWAVTPYSSDCAPINPQYYADYAAFLAAVVERYSKPPFNVRYFEIGNEPDAYVFPNDAPYGCWGIEGDPYYGGRAYGTMLKTVAPAMRNANPEIKILNGGLLLYRPYDPSDPTTIPGRFFEGMLQSGAGTSFDIVSFHAYSYFAPGTREPLGPATDWRIGYLRDLLTRFNLPAKPFMRTESALLCVDVTPECRWAQADYIGRLFVRSMRDGLLANIWYKYDRDSYHNTALIEPGAGDVPRVTYFAYRNAANLLTHAVYAGQVTGVPATVEIYRFHRGSEQIDVFWSDNPQPVAFSLPVGAQARITCIDRDGGAFPCTVQNGRLQVSAERSPIYIVTSR